MNSNYRDFSPLARTIAYFVFRKKEATYSSIKKRFGEKRTGIGIEELMSQNPPLISFNLERMTYQPSECFKKILSPLNLI